VIRVARATITRRHAAITSDFAARGYIAFVDCSRLVIADDGDAILGVATQTPLQLSDEPTVSSIA